MAAEPIAFTPSSHIQGASYDPDTQQLAVSFGASTYVYQNITQDIADAFSEAPSAGSFLHSVVKSNPSKFPYTKA